LPIGLSSDFDGGDMMAGQNGLVGLYQIYNFLDERSSFVLFK
jgi:hypothetical protein